MNTTQPLTRDAIIQRMIVAGWHADEKGVYPPVGSVAHEFSSVFADWDAAIIACMQFATEQ